MDEPAPNPPPQASQQYLPVVVRPDPMLGKHGAIFRTVAMWLGAFVVVVLVLYGMTRSQAPEQQMANVPSQATQVQPASGNAQAQKPEPSTTGRGQNSEQPKNQPQPQAQ